MSTTNSEAAQATPTGQNYPKNCWWVVAKQTEVSREPLARWLLDRPVVLYRTESNQVVALENRCVHRWAQISTGYLSGDNIVCGYHGAEFDSTGKCVHYPTQQNVPDLAKVQSYPVLERTPFIWIWMGDPEAAKNAPEPPEFPWTNNADWVVTEGTLPVSANYFLLHENFLDLTHFNYAHRKTFQISTWPVPSFKREGDKVSLSIVEEPFEIPVFQQGFPANHAMKRETLATMVSPALHTVDMVTTDLEAGPGEKSGYNVQIVHCVTPESPTKTHYWWFYGQDFGNMPGAAEGLNGAIHTAFLEDKVVLEGIQEVVDRDERAGNALELTFNGDMGGLHARRVLKKLLKEETV